MKSHHLHLLENAAGTTAQNSAGNTSHRFHFQMKLVADSSTQRNSGFNRDTTRTTERHSQRLYWNSRDSGSLHIRRSFGEHQSKESKTHPNSATKHNATTPTQLEHFHGNESRRPPPNRNRRGPRV
ncbi:Uncharacterized protein Rs2_42346 [Raphanus sativus]|nr:Uncharacterized protein Rs2_42346 [Raphanus sativus]